MSKLFDDASLAMVPSAYKDGKLYSIRPTDGDGDFTFSRGSNLAATRVDVNGLIEKGRENVLLQSNQFDTGWNYVNVSVTSGQSGYDGSSNAWLLSKSAASAHIKRTTTLSGINTFSVYAKAGTNTHLAFWIRNANMGKFFNLVNGTIESDFINTPIDAKIEAVGGGWYRCSVTTNDATNNCRIYPADADGDVSGTSGNIYIQDAQTEQGLVATDYIETGTSAAQSGILEDMPRLDYSAGASCPSLLLEPQRQNLFSHSEYLDGWNKYLATAQFDDSITNPNGTSGAYKIVSNGANNAPNIRYNNVVLSGNYSYSVFVKAGNAESVVFGFDDYDGDKVFMRFNLATNELTEYIDNNNKVTGYDLEPFDNGWYRLWVNVNLANATYNDIFLMVRNLDNSVVDAGDYFYAWGVQYEQGSYPTSYIPTYGTSQTRSGDACNTGSLLSTFDDSQGVLFAEFNPSFPEVSSRQITINDATYSNRIIIEVRESGTKIKAIVSSAGSAQFDSTKNISVVDTTYKVAIKYSATDTAFFVNGEKVSSSTGTIAMPTGLQFLSFTGKRLDNGLAFESRTKQLAYFPTALTDSECIALTSI